MSQLYHKTSQKLRNCPNWAAKGLVGFDTFWLVLVSFGWFWLFLIGLVGFGHLGWSFSDQVIQWPSHSVTKVGTALLGQLKSRIITCVIFTLRSYFIIIQYIHHMFIIIVLNFNARLNLMLFGRTEISEIVWTIWTNWPCNLLLCVCFLRRSAHKSGFCPFSRFNLAQGFPSGCWLLRQTL